MSVLLIGASGQVGGAFLTVFRRAYPSTPITLFLRTHALDEAVKSLGNITIIHGDFDTDLQLLEKLASEHDIVINAATSSSLHINEAILRGFVAYKDRTGNNAILLHLSGTGNFVDGSRSGEFSAFNSALDLPFHDTNPEQVKKINTSMEPNGASDKIILRAAEARKVDAYFVCPVGIYGASHDHIGRLAGAEGEAYANALGVWAGWMISDIVAKGYSPYVGPGTTQFFTVHVDDVVDLMMRVYTKALKDREESKYGKDSVHGESYVAAGEKWENKQIAELFAEAMVRREKLKGDGERVEVRSGTFEEAGTTAR